MLPTGAFHEGSGRMFVCLFLPKSQSRASHLVF